MSNSIRVGEPAIEVAVCRNARARRMILRVRGHGLGPSLTLPPSISIIQAQDFVRDHEAWLRRHTEATLPRTGIRDGMTLPYRGRSLTIRMTPGCPTVFRCGELNVPGPSTSLAHQVSAYLREAARQRCVGAARHHAEQVSRRIGRITLRDTRSRWGSCTSAGNLMFSWRLILAPDAVLDYVVAHEVAHLVEMNHSPAFWAVVRSLSGEHQESRAWLRQHGPDLLAFDFGHELLDAGSWMPVYDGAVDGGEAGACVDCGDSGQRSSHRAGKLSDDSSTRQILSTVSLRWK